MNIASTGGDRYTGREDDEFDCSDGGGYTGDAGLCPCCGHEVIPIISRETQGISETTDNCQNCGWQSDTYYE